MSIKNFLGKHSEIKLSVSTLRNMVLKELDYLKQNDIIFAYRTAKQNVNVKVVDVDAFVAWLKSK